MINGKFFSGLTEDMMRGNTNRPDRQKTNFFWPEEIQNEHIQSKERSRLSINTIIPPIKNEHEQNTEEKSSDFHITKNTFDNSKISGKQENKKSTDFVNSDKYLIKNKSLKSDIKFYDFEFPEQNEVNKKTNKNNSNNIPNNYVIDKIINEGYGNDSHLSKSEIKQHNFGHVNQLSLINDIDALNIHENSKNNSSLNKNEVEIGGKDTNIKSNTELLNQQNKSFKIIQIIQNDKISAKTQIVQNNSSPSSSFNTQSIDEDNVDYMQKYSHSPIGRSTPIMHTEARKRAHDNLKSNIFF